MCKYIKFFLLSPRRILNITSRIKEVAKRFGKFQQEISFYPLLNEGERSERLQAVPEDLRSKPQSIVLSVKIINGILFS